MESNICFGMFKVCPAWLGLLLALTFSARAQSSPDELLLKDYRPRSIFKIPETRPEKARYKVIDVHSHEYYATNQAGLDRWVRTMDEVGIEKTIVLTGSAGPRFDAQVALFGARSDRFELWCGINFREIDQPGFADKAIAELERCRKAGARGIGELSDKGRGLGRVARLHCDDERLDPIFKWCAEVRMPINIHIGEDQWMYETMDQQNDGLMNAYRWRIPKDPDVLGHDEVLATLDRMLAKHPKLNVIACHFANCSADLNRLGAMLDKYPNLSADIGARFAEIAPIPLFAARFFIKYQDRLLYGTDNGPQPTMYRSTFRILETDDEHFYAQHFTQYHWPHHGLALPDEVLKKIYRDNALRILGSNVNR